MILAGMLEAVGAEGYERTSVRSVLDRAGVYRQAFYDHFDDKADCYLQAYDAAVEQVETHVREAAAEHSDWAARLRAGLGAGLEFLSANQDVGRALVVEVYAAGPEALAKRTAAMERFAAFLDQAKSLGGQDSPPAIAGEGVAAGIQAVLHSRLASREGADLRPLLPEFMYFALLPYFGAEPARAELQAPSA
jgi:AcrR family transcriptional regulator